MKTVKTSRSVTKEKLKSSPIQLSARICEKMDTLLNDQLFYKNKYNSNFYNYTFIDTIYFKLQTIKNDLLNKPAFCYDKFLFPYLQINSEDKQSNIDYICNTIIMIYGQWYIVILC